MMEVMFGTPSYDKTVTADYLTSMVETSRALTARGVLFSTCVLTGNPFIDVARNKIVAHFLKKTTAESLFFIDADVGWDAEAVIPFLEHPANIVAGFVPKRDDVATYHQSALTGVIRDGYLQCVEAPTAFIRIRREVFARMDAAYPEYADLAKQTMDGETPYFRCGFYDAFKLPKLGISVGPGWIGEDIYFSRQWSKLDECIWIQPNIDFTHRGSKAWKGNFHTHAQKTGLYKVDQVA
jgi:hypothetical protein